MEHSKLRLGVAVVALAIFPWPGPLARADDRQMLVVFSDILLLPGAGEGVERISAEDDDSAGSVQVVRLAGHEIRLGSEIEWDGTGTWPDEEVVQVVSSPRIGTYEGGRASIRSNRPAVTVQYFEARPDGCYTLRTTEGAEVFSLQMTPRLVAATDGGGRRVELDYRVETSLLGPREEIPGVDLDVGAPTVVSHDAAGVVRQPVGEWRLLSSFKALGGGDSPADLIVILVKVELAPER